MNRSAVNRGIARGDLNGTDDFVWRERPHRYDQWSVEGSCRFAGDMGDEHGHISIFFDMTNGNLRPQQCLFKGETAS